MPVNEKKIDKAFEFIKWSLKDVVCSFRGHEYKYSGKWGRDTEFYVCTRCGKEFMNFRHMKIPIPSYNEAIEVLKRYE